MTDSVADGRAIASHPTPLTSVSTVAARGRLRGVKRHWPSLVALGVILLFLVAWLLRDSLSTYQATAVRPTRALLPVGASGSPLGTDGLGRDLFARILAGVPFSLLFGA